MKYLKQLSVLVAILIASVAHSQTSKDTVCMRIDDALKVLTSAKQAEVLKERVALYRQDSIYLNARISDLSLAITAFQQKDSLNKKIIDTYIAEVKQITSQKDIALKAATDLEKQLKKERVKTRLVAGAGILAVIATIFIIK